jgi:hypothetical protein
VRRTRDRLLAEESVLKLPNLPRREPRLREHLHDFICKLSLFWWKRGRIVVPAQTSANVRVDPRIRGCELVGKLVQLAHLLEQRLKLPIVDRHAPTEGTPLNEPCALAPLVLAHQDSAEFREPVGAILEPAQDLLPLLDRQRERRTAGIKAIAERARGGFIDAFGQLADELRCDGDAGQHRHDVDRTYVRWAA